MRLCVRLNRESGDSMKAALQHCSEAVQQLNLEYLSCRRFVAQSMRIKCKIIEALVIQISTSNGPLACSQLYIWKCHENSYYAEANNVGWAEQNSTSSLTSWNSAPLNKYHCYRSL